MARVTDDSRYLDLDVVERWDGIKLTDDYRPIRYTPRDDTIAHVAAEGDTWFNLAQLYYREISERAAGLWWIICDFQPQPIVDPTLRIAPGKTIYIPSPTFVRTEVLAVLNEDFV